MAQAYQRRKGLRAKAARKLKATTNSRYSLPVALNLLEPDFTGMAPNQKWGGDVTDLAPGEGWLYVAVLTELFSRKVFEWATSGRSSAEQVTEALKMGLRAVRCRSR